MTRSSISADGGGRHRMRLIVGLAAAVYVVVLAIAWIAGDVWQDRKSEELLRKARAEFSEHLEELLHAVQWCQANLVFDALGSWTNAVPHSVDEMRSIAERFYVDELNIVSSNGIVIASNLPKVVGDDWRRNPLTAAFLEMFSPTSSLSQMAVPHMAQPFRHGTVNPEFYCTYFAESFLDRSGLLQLGYTMERLVDVMTYSDCKSIREWHFGRHGYYLAVDADGDHAPDAIPADADEAMLETGVIDRVAADGESAYRIRFAFAGHLFAAIVPESEFGGQRLYGFVVFAATSALLILLFTTVIIRLVITARKVAALHREAESRTAADLAIARKIQLSSLPNVNAFAQDDLTFSIAAATHPAREVGGDYYDFFRAPDGRVALVIADVSGKGIPAALFMHEAKHAFAEALHAEGSLAAAVSRMNVELCSHNDAEMFVTAWFGLLDSATGTIEYVNAGHNRPYLLSTGGAPSKLAERGGRFLGMFPDASYRASRRQLAPGDRIVLFTDGITEAMNAEHRPFGEDRFRALLATHPTDLVAATAEAVAKHVADEEQSDDMTMLVAEWLGSPAELTRRFAIGDDTAGACVEFLQKAVALTDRRQKMRLINAVDELVANVVSYSKATTLTLAVAESGGRCRVVLTDDGVSYNPLTHRDPDTHVSLVDRPEGGLGILMVKNLVSSVGWSRDGAFNRVTLVQRANQTCMKLRK